MNTFTGCIIVSQIEDCFELVNLELVDENQKLKSCPVVQVKDLSDFNFYHDTRYSFTR
jgi:hypothetical protein